MKNKKNVDRQHTQCPCYVLRTAVILHPREYVQQCEYDVVHE